MSTRVSTRRGFLRDAAAVGAAGMALPLAASASAAAKAPGRSPIAWQGGQLSKIVAGVAARAER